MTEAVIFDMDGVLIDSELIYLMWLTEYLERKGYGVDKVQLERTIGLSSKLTAEQIGRAHV